MPTYRRKYRARRGGMRGRKRYARRRAPMTAGRVKRLIGAELKYNTVGAGGEAISGASASVTRITQISQGATITERNGDRIRPVVIHGKWILRGNTNSAADTTNVRVGIFCWKNNTDTDAPDINRIVQDSSDPNGPFKFAGRGEFTILWSRAVVLSNNSANPKSHMMLTFYKKLGKMPQILYEGADPRKYQLFYFAFSDRAIANDPPTWENSLVFRYTDS